MRIVTHPAHDKVCGEETHVIEYFRIRILYLPLNSDINFESNIRDVFIIFCDEHIKSFYFFWLKING